MYIDCFIRYCFIDYHSCKDVAQFSLRSQSTWLFQPLAHERITTFSDAQAAIRGMASDEPGRGQRYALEARKHIATIRRRRPGVKIELRWCPAHSGVPGDEKADEWAKLAADESRARHSRCGTSSAWTIR